MCHKEQRHLLLFSAEGSGLAQHSPGVRLATAKPDSNPDSTANLLAEGAGFEPARLSPNGFQDRRHRPLGHPSLLFVYTFNKTLARSNLRATRDNYNVIRSTPRK